MARLFLSCLAVALIPAWGSAQVAVLPVIGSAPETGLQYGVTAIHVRRSPIADTRSTTTQLYAISTAKRQRQLFLERDWWAASNARRAYARFEWIDFPQPFYGIGWATAPEQEEYYRAGGASLHAILMQRARGPLFASASRSWIERTIKDRDPSGALVADDVVGSSGGRTVLPSGGLTWDSRDDVFAPTRGRFVEARTGASRHGLGADYDFSRTTLDARSYLRLGAATLAVQLYAERHVGSVPFDQMSLVGGNSVMRGYARGRFRDKSLLTTQAELRLPATRRLFREARTSVRVDFAAGSHGASGLYIALNEAF